tara:strand:- start:1273 stop:1776 length:504 start_codon:yes stop_codon:yes gene_type:complete
MNTHVYNSLIKLGLTKKASTSISKLNFKGYNIHIAFTEFGKHITWCINIKKINICHKKDCSSHAEEELIKKINRKFYQNKKVTDISLYSIRINKQGEIKCAKPCLNCINCILKSRIKIKEIYYSNHDKLCKINPNKEDFNIGYGISSGRKYWLSPVLNGGLEPPTKG